MIFYILNVAILLAGCLIFYKVLLQKETFFPLNRWILIGCLALSFSLPLIPVPQQWSFRKSPATAIEQAVTQLPIVQSNIIAPVAIVPATTEKATPAKSNFFKDISIVKLLGWLYWLGVGIFAINFLVQLITLLYRCYSRPVIQDGRFRIVELTGDKAPCSFGNTIFINPEKYEWETYSQIILHEKIHIQQGHSYDILLAELGLVFQWFNPFAWMYRKAIEDNLEFLTDNELLQHKDVERSSYQMSLVKVSAPHFPISLTTNYNQSILKKRLIMMNAKKSNIHTTWKYLFIIPFLIGSMSLLNDPVAYGNPISVTTTSNTTENTTDIEWDGRWFATIKGEKMTIRFENGEAGKNHMSATCDLAEFPSIPRGNAGTMVLSRDAGTIDFNGKFEGEQGMGKYTFKPNDSFVKDLAKEGLESNENDLITYFFIDLKKNYLTMLKRQGFTEFNKGDIIPLVALKIDENFISSIKSNFKDVSLQNLIPLKALNVDGAYIKEIKAAGYPNVTVSDIITFKAQNITGDYLKSSKEAQTEPSKLKVDVGIKAVNPTDNVTGKIVVTDPEKDVKWKKTHKEEDEKRSINNLIAMKSMNITPEFSKSFQEVGYSVSVDDLIAAKSLNVTPAYIKTIAGAGFKGISFEEIISLKALNISAEDIMGYKNLGYTNLKIDDVISAISTGTTPAYIQNMKKKGYNLPSVSKYIERKVLGN